MNYTEQINALFSLIRKELHRFFRIWTQSLIPPVATSVLYFVIFGSLIGKRIGDMGGVDYMQFMAPGLVMLSVITNSYSNVVSSFFGVKFQKSIEELLVSPMPIYLIIIGFVVGGVARGIIVGLLVMITALFFTNLEVQNIPLTLLIVILTATLFSLAGMINAIFANSFDDISIVPTFVLTPLIYLGGVFYSINILSPTLQSISKANPMLYVVNTFREGMLGTSDVSISFSLIMICSFIILFSVFSMFLLNRGKGIRE